MYPIHGHYSSLLFYIGLNLKKICCNRWCYCYTAVFLIIALLSLLLIVLSQVPRVVPSVRPKYVYWNNTIELQFDQMSWLNNIDTYFNDLSCQPQGQLYVLQGQDCAELPTVTTNFVNPQSPVDSVYMRQGSTIVFTVSPGSHGQEWIFSDYESTNDFDGNPTQFNCNDPPLGAYCFEVAEYLNESFSYTITQPAFYYIRQHPPSFNVTPHRRNFANSYNRVLFEVEAIPSSATIAQLSSVSTTVNFRNSFMLEKTCVLLNIPERCLGSNRIELQASNATRRQDILLYPGISVVIFFAVLIIVVSVHVVYHHSRRQVSPNYIT